MSRKQNYPDRWKELWNSWDENALLCNLRGNERTLRNQSFKDRHFYVSAYIKKLRQYLCVRMKKTPDFYSKEYKNDIFPRISSND